MGGFHLCIKKSLLFFFSSCFFSTNIPFTLGNQNLEKQNGTNNEYPLTLDSNNFSTSSPVEWPMFHHDSMHTGFTEGIGCIEYPIEKWHFKTGDRIWSSPALSNIFKLIMMMTNVDG